MTQQHDVYERTETIVPGPAEAFAGLIDIDPPDLEREGLPLLWHWFYLLDRPRQVDLGRDGHPIHHVVVAPGPGRRRMWAGGRVHSVAPLVVGEPATRRSHVLSSTDKEGRTGTLTFVVVRHTVLQGGREVVIEDQDIVYRADSTEPAPEPAVPERVPVAEDEWEIPTDPTVLFRFSAITYNGHRIHYDRLYAREVEGYPGLITHGPLQAVAMAEAARLRGAPARSSIDYRLLSPLFDYQGLVVSASHDRSGWATTARDVGGRQTATGTVTAIQ